MPRALMTKKKKSLHMTYKNLVVVEMLYSTVVWARTCGSPDNKVK
jgi:hypothetical protein